VKTKGRKRRKTLKQSEKGRFEEEKILSWRKERRGGRNILKEKLSLAKDMP